MASLGAIGPTNLIVQPDPRRDLAPGPVRFREAVEQDHRGLALVSGGGDVEGNASAERNAAEAEAVSLGRGLGEVFHLFHSPSSPFRRGAAPSLSRGRGNYG